MSNGVTDGAARAIDSTNPRGRSPEEIQRGIRETRMQLDNTLDAIQQRLSPGGIADELVDYVRSSGANEFAHNLNESVKRNPIPVALMGVSLAWLMWSGREGQHYEADHIGDSHAMRHRLDEASDSAREQAAKVREGTRQGIRQARNSFESLMREQPLLLGALGVAAGAALGAMLPSTRQEDELMGEASEQLGEAAKQQMHLQLRKGKRVAEAASDAAMEQVQDAEQAQARSEDGLDSENIYPPTPGL